MSTLSRLLHGPDGSVRNATGALAGSALPLDLAVRNLAAWVGCPLQQAAHAASRNPRRLLLRAGSHGNAASIGAASSHGFSGDETWIDDDGYVLRTVQKGRTVFEAG